MSVIGIDLGFNTCTTATPKGGGIEVILNEYSQRQTSTTVSFGDKQRELGEGGRLKAVTNFKSTVGYFKHLLGRNFKDADVQEALSKNFYRPKEMPDGTVGFTCTHLGSDKDFSVVQITGMLLSQIRRNAEKELGTVVKDCVVGVPINFSDRQRHALLAACKVGGLNCLRIFAETSAVALAYGIYKQDLPAENEKPRRVLFADMGHSQLHLSACEMVKGKLIVQATAHEPVGGRDMDFLLFNHFADEFKGKYKIDVRGNPRAAIRLMAEVEKVKKLMSANSTPCRLNIECLMDDKDVSSSIKREDFEVMLAPMLARVKAAAERLLSTLNAEKEGKFKVDDIDFVEIVGGSVRVPAVKKVLSEVFKTDLKTTLNLDEAVARGCALMAAITSPTFRVRDFQVTEKTPFAIKLNWTSALADEENSAEVFKDNGTANLHKVLTFFRSEDFELQSSYAEPSAVPGQQNQVGAFKIEGVTPSFDGKSQKIKVKVKLDEHGCFALDSAHMVEQLPPTEEVEPAAMDTAADSGGAGAAASTAETGASASADPAPAGDGKDAPKPAAEAPADAGADGTKPDAADGAKKDEKKEPAKKKAKTTKTTPLKITTTLEGVLTEAEVHKLLEIELDLAASDRAEKEKSDAKNALEEFVYGARDDLSEKLSKFITEADADSTRSQLTAAEDWLYDEGEDVAKNVYQTKLADLQKLVAPAQARAQEAASRPPLIEALQNSVVACRRFLEVHAGGDAKYAHITADEIKPVAAHFAKTEAFMNKAIPELANLPGTEEPKTKTTDLKSEKEALDKVYIPVMTKPVPVVEPPKDEEKKDDAAAAAPGNDESAATEGAKPEAPTEAAAQGEASSMDVD